uniref:G-protein coupled receptors family 1 profile domain-containing protein n=1 Tax=Monopterus albus TaxID=43700 RepID=A0A3Q3PY28_MONAL
TDIMYRPETELCFPQLLNTSCVRSNRPYVEAMLTYVLLLSVTLLTAFLNLLVIISISHFKQLHTPTNLLILSLAVSDFFLGLLLLFQIMLIDGCWFLGDLMCAVYQCVAYIISFSSVGAMVLISVDRHVAICDPLLKTWVCLCWMLSAIFQSLILKDNLEQPGRYNSCFGECVFVINHIAGFADLLFSFIVPIIVIVVLYMRVFVVAVLQARAMRSHTAAVTLQGSKKIKAKKSELKAARTLGVVVAVFIICLCPYYCVALTSKDDLMNASSAAFVISLYYFNAVLNPLIYVSLYSWFRKSIKLILTLKILQPESCKSNIL